MEGLVKFREAFAEYSENYVVIGGAACDITMTNTVVRPRATHDIDMIVIVENMTEAFANRFWQFVREAGYRPEKRKQEAGEPPRYDRTAVTPPRRAWRAKGICHRTYPDR